MDGVSDARVWDGVFGATGAVGDVEAAGDAGCPDALTALAVAVSADLRVRRAWKRVVQCAAAGATVSSGFRRPVLHPATKIPAYHQMLSQDLIRDLVVRRRTRRAQRMILFCLFSLLHLLISGSDLCIGCGFPAFGRSG